MIEITNFRQGAVLNYHHGVETGKSLKVVIEGISSAGHPVKVNGSPAEMDGRNFSCEVELTEKLNDIRASVMTPGGIYSQELTLVWDKKSFRRCDFYIDDHSFLFTELAAQKPKSAFDHFYLKGLKEIHKKYGLKVTLNTFYRNDHDPNGFLLKDMPDIWKNEFIDNSDWLKFSFHSYSEFPDRPYVEATAEEIGRDFDLIKNEIIRFAGEESWNLPPVMHWGNISPAAAQELIRRGIPSYSNAMRPRVMGGPSLAERQKGGDMNRVEQRSMSGEDKATCTEGLQMHYGFADEYDYVKKHKCYYDPSLGIFFVGGSGCCCNLTPLAEIKKRYDAQNVLAKKNGFEIFSGATHEQYTFPFYPNYIPDHMARLEEAARCLAEDLGCKFIFFSQGLLGNTAWDK